MRLWPQRQPPSPVDASLIGIVQRIERELAAHTAEFREYKLATDIRLEIIDILATKVLPQLTRALSDSAESNRALAESQRLLNDTFERVLAALPHQGLVLADRDMGLLPMREIR